jgi:zinc transporter 1
MKNYQMRKQSKILVMISLTSTFFLVELLFGYISGSIALVADSFHMLSDVSSMVIALLASHLAHSKNFGPEYSFGLQRAEVLGALINACSLLALCFSLIIQAVQRFISPEEISNPWMVLWVALVGLIINVAGMFLFRESHPHHHHDKESITSRARSPLAITNQENPTQLGATIIRVASMIKQRKSQDGTAIEMQDGSNTFGLEVPEPWEETHSHCKESHTDLNLRGVFLHVMGDFLGSVAVISSTLIVLFCQGNWTIYMDPAISLLITCIIVYSTIPLVKSAAYILLQGTPSSISIDTLRKDILSIPNIVDVHELHVWQLSDTQMIASVHIVVPTPSNMDITTEKPRDMEKRYMDLAAKVKHKLHGHGIHSTTVQPEYAPESDDCEKESEHTCMLRCTSTDCQDKMCCPPSLHENQK